MLVVSSATGTQRTIELSCTLLIIFHYPLLSGSTSCDQLSPPSFDRAFACRLTGETCIFALLKLHHSSCITQVALLKLNYSSCITQVAIPSCITQVAILKLHYSSCNTKLHYSSCILKRFKLHYIQFNWCKHSSQALKWCKHSSQALKSRDTSF